MAEKLLSFSEFLSVLVEPKLRPVERYVHVHTGDSIGFICTISEGDPPITFQWTKDGKSASSLPNINVNEGNGYSSTLVISQSTSVHRGMYSCIAINSVGFSINIMNLEVDGNQVVAFFSQNQVIGTLSEVIISRRRQNLTPNAIHVWNDSLDIVDLNLLTWLNLYNYQ